MIPCGYLTYRDGILDINQGQIMKGTLSFMIMYLSLFDVIS